MHAEEMRYAVVRSRARPSGPLRRTTWAGRILVVAASELVTFGAFAVRSGEQAAPIAAPKTENAEYLSPVVCRASCGPPTIVAWQAAQSLATFDRSRRDVDERSDDPNRTTCRFGAPSLPSRRHRRDGAIIPSEPHRQNRSGFHRTCRDSSLGISGSSGPTPSCLAVHRQFPRRHNPIHGNAGRISDTGLVEHTCRKPALPVCVDGPK